MKVLQRGVVVLMAGLLATACGPRPANNPNAAAPITVEVTNQNRRDVTVFLIRSGTPVRLGTVISGRTSTFPYRGIPSGGESVRVGAEIIGSAEQYSSEPVRAVPGDRVILRLQDLLSTSGISVRGQ